MHYNKYIVLVVALTCVGLVPITFLVTFFQGTRGVRREHAPFALKRDRGYFSFEFDEELGFEFDEELKSLSTNCSVVKGRHFIILLSDDYKFCQ